MTSLVDVVRQTFHPYAQYSSVYSRLVSMFPAPFFGGSLKWTKQSNWWTLISVRFRSMGGIGACCWLLWLFTVIAV